VLLNVDCTYARPRGIFFRSRRRTRPRARVARRRSAMGCASFPGQFMLRRANPPASGSDL